MDISCWLMLGYVTSLHTERTIITVVVNIITNYEFITIGASIATNVAE